MKKKYVLIVVVFVIISSLMIKTDFNLDIIKAEITDRYPPQISAVSANPQIVGFGYNVTISPTVTDNQSGVNLVEINITYPDSSYGNFSMNKKQGFVYELNFSDTWQHGRYNYSIWANDNVSNANITSQHSFNVTVYSTITIATLKNNYTDNEYINITDPPNPPENFTVIDRGLTWNTFYDASSGNNIFETYQGPVNFKEENGTWMPINTSLCQLADSHPAYNYGYRIGNDRGLFGVYFKSNIQSNWPVAFAFNKSIDPTIHVIRSKLVGVGYLDPGSNWSYHYLQNVQNSQGLVNGNSILYENVFTGTNVVYSYENTKLKENIILSNATKTVLQNHPPSLYGCSNNSFLVFITKLDYQNLHLYNASNLIIGNLTVSEGQIDLRDATGLLHCSLPIGEAYELINESVRHQLTYRIIQYNGNYFLLSGLRIIDLMDMTFPVVIDPTQEQTTWLSSTNDGYIYKSSSTSYSTAWTSGTGTVSSSADYITVGQNKGFSFPNPTYYVYRGFLFFNTSSLSSNAYIDNATLSLYKKGDNSTTDFTITVQNGQPTYPHNPLLFGDYSKSHYSGNGGGLNTTNFANGRNNITLTNHSWIQKAGMTKLCLRSSRDISGTIPTGKEYVEIYSREKGTSYAPKLSIIYRNQSKIKNTGSTNIRGYLLIQIQYYYDQSWHVADDIVNETTPRTINTGNHLALDAIFNGLVNSSDLPFGNGTYRVYTAFRDPYGNALICSDNQVLIGYYEFHLVVYCQRWRKLSIDDGFGTGNNVATRGICIYPKDSNNLYIGTENLNKSKLWKFNLNGFAANTQITMADETIQDIENIESGDFVKAFNRDTFEYVNATVQEVYQSNTENAPGYTININNDIHASLYQVLVVNGTLKEAKDIDVGDILVDVNRKNTTVTSISNITNTATMYSFTIGVSPYDNLPGPNNLTFFAENIEAYSWGTNGNEEVSLEGEAFGIGLNLGGTIINEAIMIHRAHASDGCEIWKYNPENTPKWTPVMTGGNGDTTNWGAGVLIEFNGYLFVGTWSSPAVEKGCQIWRYDGSTWMTVIDDGFGDNHNMAVTSMCVFNSKLYVGTMNFNWGNDGFCQVWRTTNDDGTRWEQVIDKGFREIEGVDDSTARNAYAWRMAEFKGKLYVSNFNIPIPGDGQRGCQLFRTETGNPDPDDWEKVSLINGDGFGENLNYGIRGLVPWKDQYGQDQYLYVGVAACFFQIKKLLQDPIALEIWRYDGTDSPNAWQCIIGDETTPVQTDYSYDGFGSYYNKYPWSMLRINNKLWIGTWNYQYKGDPESYGCEVWCYDYGGSTITPIVKNKTISQPTEKQSGFGYQWNVGARSMIEYPTGSGHLVVGTVSLQNQYNQNIEEKGCEVWLRNYT